MGDIMDKLRKLQAMAKSGGPEADNAQRLIDKLMEKHQIDSIEEKSMYRIKCNRRINSAAIRLAHSLGLGVKHYKGKGHQIYVYCTPTELTVFEPLMAQLQRMYLDKVTAAAHFVDGFVNAVYPSEVICPKCGTTENDLITNVIDRRIECPNCGWKSRKFKIADEHYRAGSKNANKLIA